MVERGRNKKRGPLSKEARARQAQRRQKEIEQLKDISVSALETFTPLGDVQTAKDASKAFQEGRYLDAAGNAALIGLGYTPLGPLARPAGRLAKRVARDKDMLVPALTDKDYASMVTRETLMGKAPLSGKSVGAATAKTKTEKDLISGLSPEEIKFQKENPGMELLFHGSDKERADDLMQGYREGQLFLSPDPEVASKYGSVVTAIPVKKGTSEKMILKNRISGSKKPRAEGREQVAVGPIGEAYRKRLKAEGLRFENIEAEDFLKDKKPFKFR